MEYADVVDNPAPGWRHFRLEDLDRLPADARRHEMDRVPAGDKALVLRGDSGATDRVLRFFFWTLVYHLEPERWDALAGVEPIHAEVLEALPSGVARAVDVGAGSGRLTRHLVERAGSVIAIEPSAGLRHLMAGRLPSVVALPGWAEALPLGDGISNLTAACGSFGPDPAVLDELRRVTAPGGSIALISPECPEWFEEQGWRRVSAAPISAPPHPQWIDDFFGPPDPPRVMVLTTKG